MRCLMLLALNLCAFTARGETDGVVEIRSYRLKPGTREGFHERFVADALPMLERFRIDVVAYGPSLHDDDSYFLMRAFPSVEERQQSEDTFYGSDEWREGPREAILADIDGYTTVVVRLDEATLQGLRKMGGNLMSSDLDTLLALNEDYIRSVQTSDVARFEEILGEDFLCSLPDGSLLDRERFLEQTALPVSITNLEAHDVNVRLMGDFAIVHARTTYTTKEGRQGSGRYTDVWARRNGRWLAVSAHVTRNESRAAVSSRGSRAWELVLAGGVVAGTLDILYACAYWGIKSGVPARRIFQSVAAGLLGPASFKGGGATAALGLALHFFIALMMSLVYYVAAGRWLSLRDRSVLCGAAYGLFLYGFMNHVVVPLSAARPGSRDPLGVALSIAVHVAFVGIPIAVFSGLAHGATTAQASTSDRCCDVIELRQYTLKPGQRETLIELFERAFIEPQEEAGMSVVGQFRDRRRDDRFVWVRGFEDMKRRRSALERFYGGPVWTAHRDAANATMVDSDDVLLLKPARPDLAFRLGPRDRPSSVNLVVAGIHALTGPPAARVARFEERVLPLLAEKGIHVNGVFVTESAPNDFRLPVREGENVLVWFGVPEGAGGVDLERLASECALDGVKPDLLELTPTSRSRFGGE